MLTLILALLAAAPCPPRAVIEGDAALAASVGAALAARGVELDGGDGSCTAVRAHLTSSDRGVVVSLRDGSGRAAEHVVSVPELAVDLIDGWARPDLAGDLVAPPPPPPELPVQAPATPALESAPLRLAPSVALETSVASDGAVGGGVRLGTALARHGLQPFAALRLALAPHVTAPGLPLASRSSGDLLVGLRWSLPLGALRLAPGIAVGAGVTSTGRASEDCGFTCVRPVVGDGMSATRAGARAELGLSAALPLSESMQMDLGLSAIASPFGRASPLVPGYLRSLPGASSLALTAEPSWTLAAALGVRWGSP